MAKMRGIKPETFTDDKILQLSPLARWLFVGIWTLACDNGHVEDNFVQLKVRILPMDSCDMAELINELIRVGLLERCSGYLKIPNLPKHQKIDRRFLLFCKWCAHDEHASFDPGDKLPRTTGKGSAPVVQDPTEPDNTSGARSVHDVQPASTRRAHVDEGEGEGEGEGEIPISVDPADKPQAELIPEPPSATASDMFEQFWQAYPKRTPHSNPKKPAREKFMQIAKTTDPQLLIDAAHAYAKIRRGQDPHFTAQAIKWLRDERWNDEVVVPIRPKPQPQPEFVPLLQRHQETIQRRRENG